MPEPAAPASARSSAAAQGAAAASRRARGDALCVAAAALLTFVVGAALELAEAFYATLQRYEHWQADELPLAAVVAALGMAWFAWRRRGEARTAQMLHERAEIAVGELLDRNRALAQQLIAVQENERRALARELHDEVGQRCTAIRIDAALIARGLAGADAAVAPALAAECAATERIALGAQALHDSVRALLRRLRPAELDELGLVEALQALCETWEATSGVACVLHHEGELGSLGDAADVALYRIAQEGLSNVMRHARASHVRLKLAREADAGVSLDVHDDGIGLDPAATVRGLGLLGAAERAAALGGQLDLHGAPGAGLHLRVRLPAAALDAAGAAPPQRVAA